MMARIGGIELNIVPVAAVAAIMTIIVLVLGVGVVQSVNFSGVEEHQHAQDVFATLVDDIEEKCRSIGNENERIQLGRYDLRDVASISVAGTTLYANGKEDEFQLTRDITECSDVQICTWNDRSTCTDVLLEGGDEAVIDYFKPHADGIKLMRDTAPPEDDGG